MLLLSTVYGPNSTDIVKEGWLGIPKGLGEVLWERGWIVTGSLSLHFVSRVLAESSREYIFQLKNSLDELVTFFYQFGSQVDRQRVGPGQDVYETEGFSGEFCHFFTRVGIQGQAVILGLRSCNVSFNRGIAII